MAQEHAGPDEEVAPETPRASSSGGDAAAENHETLLSAPQPAERFEVETDARLTALETRLVELEQKLDELSRRPRRETPRELWWLVFLLALALTWQLVVHFK
jgi:hypothetical protein